MTEAGDPLHPAGLEAIAIEVAGLAADFVHHSLGAATAASTKSSPTDVVTETDLQTEQLIREELTSRCPGSSIVGEEYDDQVGTNGVGWIVDPIDGTVNFLYDLPIVSVSIAATTNDKVVAGAVADIVRGECFSAALGTGSRRDGNPISASASPELGTSLVATGFSYSSSLRAAQAAALAHIVPAARDLRCMGSAALNLCWVACGRLDAYYERDLKIYDYAAGGLIAAEAGAAVELPVENDYDLLLAASPHISSSLRDLVVAPLDGLEGER